MTNKESDQFRYLFTVRQQFGEPPRVDSFYELSMPAGITGEQAQVMTKLNKKWCKDEIAEDTQALHGMQLRLRFNSDMFQHVCLVRTHCEITCDELDNIITMKNVENKLIDFLDESAIK
jgi:hypothetical protein